MINIVKPVIWGLKNSDKLLNMAYTVRNCKECSDTEFSDKDSFCENHQDQYNELLQKAPYGRSIRDILGL